ncbi:hypothetical protein [Nitratifractor salsuginis]|uniref:Terminase small subunit n=1 Tax=Nitratifractor salsuginis (strain DSM 16511 / JCM 12458 / E9I37-1) TaxID=749222 RepID=E6X1P9_NITSE|nr:hypothetical protein [Nitratifractor salsuginis]ADV47040.1 hypothetical protein Nitsa_1795 [Nitratifractor salsuginis DSM 16511]
MTAKEIRAKLKADGVADYKESRFSQLVAQGRIPYHIPPGEKRKRYIYEEVKRAVLGNCTPKTELRAKAAPKKHEEEIAEAKKLKEEAELAGILDVAIDLDTATLNEVKIFKEYILALKNRAEYAETVGALVRREEVNRHVMEAGISIKSALMSMPSRLASRLVEIDDPREMEAVLMEEVVDALSNLSKAFL